MKVTKQGQHAIDFAIFCTGWHYAPNDDFEDGYAWRNAEIGNVPFDGMPLRILSSEKLYQLFLETNKLEAKTEDLPAENTVMWWLCRIADDEVRRKSVGNCIADDFESIRAHKIETDVNEAIYSAWLWSIEDGEYWLGIAKSEIPLLPAPEFKEYLELRK